MRPLRALLIAATFGALSCASTGGGGAESAGEEALQRGLAEGEIRETFSRFMQSVFSARGREAVRYIDQASQTYYAQMVKLALFGTREEILALPLVDAVLVLGLRLDPGPEVLRMLPPLDVLVFTIDHNFQGRGKAVPIAIGEVTLKRDRARGRLVVDGAPSESWLDFSLEEEGWRLHYPSFIALSEAPWKAQGKQLGLRGEALILWLLTQATGKQPPDNLWDPPGLGF